MAERIRQAVEQSTLECEGAEIRYTVSQGVCAIEGKQLHLTIEQMLKAADSALYEAKKSGRNRVVLASQD